MEFLNANRYTVALTDEGRAQIEAFKKITTPKDGAERDVAWVVENGVYSVTTDPEARVVMTMEPGTHFNLIENV